MNSAAPYPLSPRFLQRSLNDVVSLQISQWRLARTQAGDRTRTPLKERDPQSRASGRWIPQDNRSALPLRLTAPRAAVDDLARCTDNRCTAFLPTTGRPTSRLWSRRGCYECNISDVGDGVVGRVPAVRDRGLGADVWRHQRSVPHHRAPLPTAWCWHRRSRVRGLCRFHRPPC